MTKAILFDLDGIVLVPRKEYFSARYAREHGVPQHEVSEFFEGEFKKCSLGQCDMKEELVPYLSKWKWQGTVDGFVRYWFETESAVDQRVLDIIDRLRKAGYKCYIASRQEKHRMRYLLEDIGLKRHFDGTFSTSEIGFDKAHEEFWKCVLSMLQVSAEEVLFFDDNRKNVDVAKESGIDAHFYDGIHTLEHYTRPLIPGLV